MAPLASPIIPPSGAIKAKRPSMAQTNGGPVSKASQSPSMSNRKTPQPPKQPTPTAAVTTSAVRPINRIRGDAMNGLNSRSSRQGAGNRATLLSEQNGLHAVDNNAAGPGPLTRQEVLKRARGKPPSLIVHLYQTHFRFDGQEGKFPFNSPMSIFLRHLREKTIPHDLLEYLVKWDVPFYDGCLIVQVHDHKSLAEAKSESRDTKQSAPSEKNQISAIHRVNPYVTPSPFAKHEDKEADEESSGNASTRIEDGHTLPKEEARSSHSDQPKVHTCVLHPTQESLQMDLYLKAYRSPSDTAAVPPTPSAVVPPTPNGTNMPPPAKRQKREKTELHPSDVAAAEGQILLATSAPLYLEPVHSIEEQIALLEAMQHADHSEPPPQPKTRKRTSAELKADEAAAAEHERYMLTLDDRYDATSGTSTAATDANSSERFDYIRRIREELREKKELEKKQQEENQAKAAQQKQQQELLQQQQQQRQLQQQREQQAQQQQQQQAQQAQQQAQQQQERENARLAREQALAQQRQQQVLAARANAANNQGQAGNMEQGQHHMGQNGMPNGMQNGMAVNQGQMMNGMTQAQQRFQSQMAQGNAASPVARQGTPQNMSSPMVGSVAMQQTSSAMAGSPPRPPSVAQNGAGPMSVPMSHAMSARGSQQSHPAGTPRGPVSTPQMAHGTPINRPAMVATPRMSQAGSPPNMAAQGSQQQMNQAMMMNNGQQMNQQVNPQMAQQIMMQQQQHMAQQQQLQAMQQQLSRNAQYNALDPQQQRQMLMMAIQQQQQRNAQNQAQQQQAQQQQNQQAQQGQQLSSAQLAQQYAAHLQQLQNQNGQSPQGAQMTPQQMQMYRMRQLAAQQGNNGMQQGQMMNGNQQQQIQQQMAAAMRAQQQQQQQLQQQQGQQMQNQQQGPMTPQRQFALQQKQLQAIVSNEFQQKLTQIAASYGGSIENIPQNMKDSLRQQSQQSLQHRSQALRQQILMRQAQQGQAGQQNQAQQQHAQQMAQQQQQQMAAAMQGMGNMMGQQGM